MVVGAVDIRSAWSLLWRKFRAGTGQCAEDLADLTRSRLASAADVEYSVPVRPRKGPRSIRVRYTEGRYAYDPRLSSGPIAWDDYMRAMRGLNPGGFKTGSPGFAGQFS